MNDHRVEPAKDFHINSFDILLADAYECLKDSRASASDPTRSNRSARFCVFTCALLVEALANNCVAHLCLPPRLIDRVDQWPTLDKYDLLYRERVGPLGMDRGCRAVQCVAELIAVRNDYAHPRVLPQSTLRDLPHLRIPTMPSKWNAAHAERALRATLDFLRTFLVEWCALEHSELTKFLRSEAEMSTGYRWALVFKAARVAVEEMTTDLKIDLDFLGLQEQDTQRTAGAVPAGPGPAQP